MGALSRGGIASLLFLGAALVFGFVLGFVLAFASSEGDPWEERWPELGVDEVEFVFLGDLTSDEKKSIRRELRIAQVVFAEHFGAVSSDFTAYVSTDRDALNEHYARHVGEGTVIPFTCGGRAPRGAVFLILEGCPRNFRTFGGPLAHEYFHILQHEAGTLLSSLERELALTVEGSASYAQALVSDARGRIPLDVRREGLRLSLAAGAGSVYSDPYGVGLLGMDWLAEGAGPEAVLEFFRLGGHRAAFETAFGISPTSFHSSFEAYRRVVAPPFKWSVSGRVLGTDGTPVEGIEVLALVRIEGVVWTAGTGETGPEGDFEFTVPGNGYTLGFFIQCPRDDILQWVYAGEWGAVGFVADRNGLLDQHERGARPFTDGERDRTGLVIELPETRESLVAKHCEF